MLSVRWVVVTLFCCYVTGENVTQSGGEARDETWDSCESGPFGTLLEEWALSAPISSTREGRILALPATNGYYVTDRIGSPGMMPPLSGPQSGPHPYDEWRPPPTPPAHGKIVNRPPLDKFKPSFPPPSPNAPSVAADRVDPPTPQRPVSETDLVLLSAIEKLTFRLDNMEKRLRKMEDSMHLLVAGAEPHPEPCAVQFSRVGDTCYHFSGLALDWKAASSECRRLRGHLLELDTTEERRQVTAALQADKRLKDSDWWTGGLNPGLLWMWSYSARPVGGNSTGNATGAASGATIGGEGRCLSLSLSPAVRAHVYRGRDCAARQRYVCELERDRADLANEIHRVARTLLVHSSSPSPDHDSLQAPKG